MKNQIKSFISGVVFTLFVCCFIIPVLAETAQLSVTYNNIKIALNGKVIASDQQPFITGGRTFVPVRVIAEAFGKNVTMNKLTNTVEITDIAVAPVNPTATPVSTPTAVKTLDESHIIPIQKIDNVMLRCAVKEINGEKFFNPLLLKSIYIGDYFFSEIITDNTMMFRYYDRKTGNSFDLKSGNPITKELTNYGEVYWMSLDYFNKEILPIMKIVDNPTIIQ